MDVMIASTSHDMRTPLNSVNSMLDLIESQNTNPKIKKWIDVAKMSTG